MPAFTFTSPEGKQYTVNGPDGATKEQAFAVLQQQLAAGTAMQPGQVRQALPNEIPQADAQGNLIPAAKPTPPADPSLVDRVIGGGETALALATGLTGGTIGTIGGTAKGLVNSVRDGTFGTPQGADQVEQAAGQGAAALTYQPRTQTGQDYTQAAGDAMNAALPVTMMPELAAVGAGARTAGRAVADRTGLTKAASVARDLVTAPKGTPEPPIVAQIRKASPAIADRVQRTLARNPLPVDVAPEPASPMPVDTAQFDASRVNVPTPGTKGSVGAAAVDMADQRRQLASDLPVPIDLTKGQAERSFEQQRFEREAAKDPNIGEPLRDRFAQQNENILNNFDAWVDKTGAEAPSLRAVGAAVDDALTQKAARDKTQIRVAYKDAEKAGEMADPVSLAPVIDYLNESAPDAETAPVLNAIRKHVVKLGIADEQGGQLVPTQPKAAPYSGLMNTPADQPGVTLKTAETLRQAINRATDFEPTNIRQATIVKGIIDSATENAGGDLYRAARRLRENFAKQYEDRAVVAKLLNNKKGMADRQVALEDVWGHAIMKGSLDDVRHVRRVLQTGGEQGQQAWRELQGQTLNWIKSEATKNVATDTRGNPIVSAAQLNKAIRTLDADGKLDFMFGKSGAQQLRDINELSKVVFTSPPGSVNSSNTASVLLAALTEAGATGALTGIPVPVLSSLRLIAKHVKNRQIQKRIDQALSHRAAADKNPPPARPPGATLH
jgi:hypothetical protein